MHISALSELKKSIKFTAVYDIDKERAKYVSQSIVSSKFCKSVEELLSQDIQLVNIPDSIQLDQLNIIV